MERESEARDRPGEEASLLPTKGRKKIKRGDESVAVCQIKFDWTTQMSKIIITQGTNPLRWER